MFKCSVRNDEVKPLLLVYQNTHFQFLPVDHFFRVGASTNDHDTFLLIWIFSIYLFIFFLGKELSLIYAIWYKYLCHKTLVY